MILKNQCCFIKFDPPNKEIFGRNLTDHYNDPAFYNITKRGIKKAWEHLKNQFTQNTTMHETINILMQQGVRCRCYCMMD